MTDSTNSPQAINGESLNLTEHHIEQLKQLFPNVFSEGKIDFDALKSELGEFVETDSERYQFTWAGKEQAKRIASTPSLGTLRPAQDESVNWDSTENLYIEGDNLEVLKLLQKSYFGKVKMIYIDPPYNTGKDFVYKDDFKDNLANYQRLTGQKDSDGNPLTTNSDSAGRYHSNWLNMMYPRLKLARNLLKDDGVIFISIDEKEFHNLKKMADEVFGEVNYAGEIVWKNSSKNDQAYISVQHEYVVSYVKSKNANKGDWLEKKDGLEIIYKAFSEFKKIHGEDWDAIHKEALNWYKQFPESNPITNSKHYSWMDERGIYFPDNISKPANGYYYDILHPTTNLPCKKPAGGWRFIEETMKSKINENRIHFGKDHTVVPNNKTYLESTEFQSLTSIKFKDGRVASNMLKELFGQKDIFTNPKDISVLIDIFKATQVIENDIVLDFFSGSATTAHAIMQLNAEDGCNRKFILVQIPEPTPDNSEARKAGYNTIAEIGKERIRRSVKKIQEEHPDTQADLGFKVFKLDTSNIKKWQPNKDDLENDLLSAVDNILPDRTSQDLLFEVFIKYGLPLTLPIEQINIQNNGKNYQAWNVANNALIACFDENITLETVQAIANLSTPENPVLRVVFRDTSFTDDITKTNAIQRLKQTGIEDVLSI